MALPDYINLNNPAQNKLYTQAGGNANYALDMSNIAPIDPETGRSEGGAVRVIPWVNVSGYETLPDFVKDAIQPAWRLVESGQVKMAWNPLENVKGYAINPETGQIILKSSEQGGQQNVEAFVKKDNSGNFVAVGGPAPTTLEEARARDAEAKAAMATNFTTATATTATTATATTAATATVTTATTATTATGYTGSGIAGDPLKFNGTPFTGSYLGQNFIGGISEVASAAKAERQSAYDALLVEFNKYGLGSLVERVKGLIEKDVPPSQFVIELRNTPEYQQRFSANQERLKRGFAALNEATYIQEEDRYRQILRTYGLTQFDNDAYVQQFLANDIRAEELGERVVTAVNRVMNADKAITNTLRNYYGLADSDMIAAILDPKTQLPAIQRQIAAAEIGTAAGRQGLNAGRFVSEQLAAQGVTKEQAERGYATIAEILPTAEKLSDIYGTTLDRYTLPEAEQEVFNQLASAQRKRQRLVQREIAEFGGSSGVGRGSLGSQTGGQI